MPITFNDEIPEAEEDEEDYFKPVTEDLDEDSFFELDDGTLLFMEQAGQTTRAYISIYTYDVSDVY